MGRAQRGCSGRGQVRPILQEQKPYRTASGADHLLSVKMTSIQIRSAANVSIYMTLTESAGRNCRDVFSERSLYRILHLICSFLSLVTQI